MQWQEVREIYPNQYVLIEILNSHTEGSIQYVDDVALIRTIQDPDEATKELLKCKNNHIVYHTGQEQIAIELRSITPNRLIRTRKLQAGPVFPPGTKR
jgi:hypothetical protein